MSDDFSGSEEDGDSDNLDFGTRVRQEPLSVNDEPVQPSRRTNSSRQPSSIPQYSHTLSTSAASMRDRSVFGVRHEVRSEPLHLYDATVEVYKTGTTRSVARFPMNKLFNDETRQKLKDDFYYRHKLHPGLVSFAALEAELMKPKHAVDYVPKQWNITDDIKKTTIRDDDDLETVIKFQVSGLNVASVVLDVDEDKSLTSPREADLLTIKLA